MNIFLKLSILLTGLLVIAAGVHSVISKSRQMQIQEALIQLTIPNGDERVTAIYTFADLNAREAIPAITKLLQHKDSGVRDAALMALKELGVEITPPVSPPADEARRQRIKEALIQITTGPGWSEQESAAKRLIALNAKEVIPEITGLLQDNDPKVRGLSAQALGLLDDLGAKEAIPEITTLLKDKDSRVRKSALIALMKLDAKKSIPDIIQLLQNKEIFGVRNMAIEALWRLDAKEAIPDLAKLLQDNNQDIRRAARAALKELGTEVPEENKK
ncbi:MAG: HEAT repeat domain-containing protein [Candidatus Brocadiia bacterium]